MLNPSKRGWQMGQTKPRKRGGGRAGNANRRGTASIEQMPWRVPVITDRPTEPRDEGGEGCGFALDLGEHVMFFDVVVHREHLAALPTQISKGGKVLRHVAGQDDLSEMGRRRIPGLDPVDHHTDPRHVREVVRMDRCQMLPFGPLSLGDIFELWRLWPRAGLNIQCVKWGLGQIIHVASRRP